jgi:hypothetical protein
MRSTNIFDQLGPLLATMLPMIPQFLVWVFGFVLALVHWGRHPRVCALTVIAVVTAAAGAVATRVVFTLIPPLRERLGFENLSLAFGIAGFVGSCVVALAWALLLAAVFSGRNAK